LLSAIKGYNLREYYDDDSSTWVYFQYTVYDVILEADGKHYNAFGCGTTNAHSLPAGSQGNAYPYNEMNCQDHEICGY
jgi:hypothetical protein